MNIIFLDIDGVLNSVKYHTKEKKIKDISDYHLQMLAEIYHKCNAKIVLSSTWRELDCMENEACRKMYKYLLDELARYNMEIISKTPVIEMDRPLEISTWLEEHGGKDSHNFVILDDDWSKEYYDKYDIGDHLVKTIYFCREENEGGLQPEHVEKAIKILSGYKNK